MSIVLDGDNGITSPTYGGTDTSEYLVPVTAFKNRIINGAMMIDQRNAGSSQTITAGTTPYTADRWIGYFGGGNGTSQRIGSAGSYSLQFTGGAGVNGWQCIQRIEAKNIADCASQNVTISFTVSSSTQTVVGLFYNTPTSVDNFASLNSAGTINGSVPVTSTPTRLSYTFAMPSTATNGFQVFFQLGAFTSGTFTIADVQLEKGSTATSFDYRPYSQELALCQRYYQTSYFGNAVGTATTSNQIQYTASGTFSYWSTNVFFQETMRASPTVTSYSPVNGASGSLYSGSATVSAQTNAISPNGYQETVNGTSVTAGFNITFHYAASAEL